MYSTCAKEKFLLLRINVILFLLCKIFMSIKKVCYEKALSIKYQPLKSSISAYIYKVLKSKKGNFLTLSEILQGRLR